MPATDLWPDRDLALIFKIKPLEGTIATEVVLLQYVSSSVQNDVITGQRKQLKYWTPPC